MKAFEDYFNVKGVEDGTAYVYVKYGLKELAEYRCWVQPLYFNLFIRFIKSKCNTQFSKIIFEDSVKC